VTIARGASASDTSDVWIYDLASGMLSPLTTGAFARSPNWTPDGRRIAYVTGLAVGGMLVLPIPGEQSELRWAPADGSGPEERLYAPPAGFGVRSVAFARDGRLAVLHLFNTRTGRGELWQLPLSGPASDRRATPLLQLPFDVSSPTLSPDGHLLAYVSRETGENEVYVRPFPGPGGRVPVSSGGGRLPTWAPDGRTVFYQPSTTNGRLVAASVARSNAGTPTLAVTERIDVFPRGPTPVARGGVRTYDVRRDTNGFVLLQPPSAESGDEIVVVLNWREELRARTARRGASREP
jgi:eukaryotic-like serine/threonine-protein kinase